MNPSDTDMPPPARLTVLPLTWPASELDQAIGILAKKSGFLSKLEPIEAEISDIQKGMTIPQRIENSASRLGIATETISISYTQVSDFLGQGGPALLRIPSNESDVNREEHEARFLVLLPARTARWRVKLLSPDGSVHRVKVALIRSALCYSLETPWNAEVDRLLKLTNLPEERHEDLRLSILQERLQHHEITDCWLLRLSPSAPLHTLARHSGLPRYLLQSVVGQAIRYALYLGAYGVIGQAALGDDIDWALLLAGILIWFSGYPFLLTKMWADKMLSFGIGHLIKERLFYGVLRLDLENVRQVGVGQFFAWLIESQTLEEAILMGGLMALSTGVSLFTTAMSLVLLNGREIGLLLLCWLGLTGLISWRLLKSYLALNEYYSGMTLDVLERIQGHQTRLIQENKWYYEEDKAIAHYLEVVEPNDKNIIRLLVLIPSGWLIVGLLAISIRFISEPGQFVTLGGTFLALLLAFQLLETFAWGTIDFVRAIAAWYLIAPIQEAANQQAEAAPLTSLPEKEKEKEEVGALILQAQDLFFRYQTRSRVILAGCSLDIYAGDRLLLEGPSGGGKSTFASVLIGLLTPESGLLLLHGLDQHSIGMKGWRQRIVAAPQFQENYLLNNTLAFNLLMGRGWPPTEEDLAEAAQICRELGLGDLLDRMPLGLQEMVGEEGWQLSHGESSRVYIARTLLQKADLIILDESFASLDPENMEVALRCVLKRAPTLLVIAHP